MRTALTIKGNIDSHYHVYFDLVVAGYKRAVRISSMFDSGYSGCLSLPITIAAPLGLMLCKNVIYKIADDRLLKEPVCKGKLLWNNKWRIIDIDIARSEEVLFGVSLPKRLGGEIIINYDEGIFTITT